MTLPTFDESQRRLPDLEAEARQAFADAFAEHYFYVRGMSLSAVWVDGVRVEVSKPQ